ALQATKPEPVEAPDVSGAPKDEDVVWVTELVAMTLLVVPIEHESVAETFM
ncbi:MAG: hypothetical protein RL085_692, partial [Actinomycetota bacterium]